MKQSSSELRAKPDASGFTVDLLFDRQVHLHPDNIAIKTHNNEISYSELGRRSNMVASHVLNRLDSNSSKYVPIILKGFIDTVVNILGIFKAGRIATVLSPESPGKLIAEVINDLEPDLVVIDRTSTDILNSCPRRNSMSIFHPGQWETDGEVQYDRPEITAQTDALMTFTSGSTGKPKGLIRNHENIVTHVNIRKELFELSSEDRVMVTSDLQFSRTLGFIFWSLLGGASIYGFDAKNYGINRLPKWLVQNEISLFSPTSSLLRAFAKLLKKGDRFPHLKVIRTGAEPLFKADLEILKPYLRDDCLIWLSYGSSESGFICAHFIDNHTVIQGLVVPVGRPVPSKTVRLIDHEGNEVNQGEVGEITVKSKYVVKGYWNNPELSSGKFKKADDGETIFFTGDYGKWLDNGMLEIVGRNDEMIKIRGYRVELGAIASVLSYLPEVEEAVALAVPNSSGNKQVNAYIALKEPLSLKEMKDKLRKRLPDYMIPAQFVLVDKLPRLAGGKVDRQNLINDTQKRLLSDDEYQPPQTKTECEIEKIWSQILGMESIGVNDSFIDLGGDSISTALMLSEIEEKFQVELLPEIILKYPTIRMLGEFIDDSSEVKKRAIGTKQEEEAISFLLEGLKKPAGKRNFKKTGSLWFRSVGRYGKNRSLLQQIAGGISFLLVKLPLRISVSLLPFTSLVRICQFLVNTGLDHLFISTKDRTTLAEFSNSLDTGVKELFLLKSRLFFMLNYYGVFQEARRNGGVNVHIEGIERLKNKNNGVILLGSHTMVNKWLKTLDLEFITLGWVGNLLRSYNLDIKKYGSFFYTNHIRNALERLDSGGLVQIVADGQNGSGKTQGVNILGTKRLFSTGFADLALNTGAEVVPIYYNMESPNELTLGFGEPLQYDREKDHDSQVEGLVKQYVAELERVYLSCPWIINIEQMRKFNKASRQKR